MKKIVALIIALMCFANTAFASTADIGSASSEKLNFDIFRYICSRLIRSEDNSDKLSSETNTSDTAEEKNSAAATDNSAKYRTLRGVAASMCVAASVSKAIVDGDDVTKVVYYTGTEGKAYECYFNYKSYAKNPMFTYEDITEGSIFYAGITAEGFVSNYAVVAVVDKSTKMFKVDENAVKENFNSKRVSCSFSYITDIRYRNGKTIVSLGNGEDLTVVEDAAQFTYNNYGRNSEVYAGYFTKSRVDTPEYDEENDVTEVYMVFAMNYEDETVAICSITTPAYVRGNIED